MERMILVKAATEYVKLEGADVAIDKRQNVLDAERKALRSRRQAVEQILCGSVSPDDPHLAVGVETMAVVVRHYSPTDVCIKCMRLYEARPDAS